MLAATSVAEPGIIRPPVSCNAAAQAEATCSCIVHVNARTSNLAVDAGVVHRASLSGGPDVAADNLPEHAPESVCSSRLFILLHSGSELASMLQRRRCMDVAQKNTELCCAQVYMHVPGQHCHACDVTQSAQEFCHNDAKFQDTARGLTSTLNSPVRRSMKGCIHAAQLLSALSMRLDHQRLHKVHAPAACSGLKERATEQVEIRGTMQSSQLAQQQQQPAKSLSGACCQSLHLTHACTRDASCNIGRMMRQDETRQTCRKSRRNKNLSNVIPASAGSC